MKRITSFLLALILAFSLCAGVSAAGEDYTYSVLANGKTETDVKLGDNVTVTFNVRENNSKDTTKVWAMQGYVCFDPDYLEIAEIVPAKDGDGDPIFSSTATRTYDRYDNVLTNRSASSLTNTVSMSNPYVAVTVTFKTLKAGTTNVVLKQCEAFQPNGSTTEEQKCTVGTENAVINIGNGPTTHTVTFDYNDGTGKTGTQEVEEGGKLAEPADPTRDGYDFAGWYKNAAGTEAWDFDKDTVDANTTIYAKWSKKAPTQYTLTFETNGGSSIASITRDAGTVIALDGYVPAKTDYDFEGWYSDSALTSKVTSVTLDGNKTVYANWTEIKPDMVTLTFETNGGTRITAKSFEKGTTVDLTKYSPTRSGYTFLGWYSDAALKNKVTSVTMNADTTVYADWEKKDSSHGSGSNGGNGGNADEDKLPFVDVDKDAYYYDPVKWAVDNGITTGTSATTFSPDGPCTRAQMVTFLWRTSGCPEAESTDCPFTDVQTDAYYYKALLWAIETGVTKGTSPTTFSPNDICTRGQMVTFLHRYNGEPAVSASNPFTDVQMEDFFYTPVVWAADTGITKGTSATTFAPYSPCTRAQIVTFLYRSVNG